MQIKCSYTGYSNPINALKYAFVKHEIIFEKN